MKIAIYGISKNEESNVEGFMDSIGDIPVFILDHSTDRTSALLRARGAVVDTTPITPFDFDAGKNAALAMVPDEFTFVLNMDIDEQLVENAREIFKNIKPHTNLVRHFYKPDAKIDRVRHECRLHHRRSHFWRLPIHEHLQAHYPTEERIQAIDELLLTQYPSQNRKHTWSVKLLDAVERFPNEPRLRMLCGRDLYFDGRYDEAIKQLGAWFSHMRGLNNYDFEYVHSMLAKCWAKKGDPIQELKHLELTMSVCEFRPVRREAYVELAHAYMKRGLWVKCREYARKALKSNVGEFAPHYDPGAWSFKPYELLMISLYNLRDTRHAIEHGEKALSLATGADAVRIAENLKVIKESV